MPNPEFIVVIETGKLVIKEKPELTQDQSTINSKTTMSTE